MVILDEKAIAFHLWNLHASAQLCYICPKRWLFAGGLLKGMVSIAVRVSSAHPPSFRPLFNPTTLTGETSFTTQKLTSTGKMTDNRLVGKAQDLKSEDPVSNPNLALYNHATLDKAGFELQCPLLYIMWIIMPYLTILSNASVTFHGLFL